jgi:hypothetical protein
MQRGSAVLFLSVVLQLVDSFRLFDGPKVEPDDDSPEPRRISMNEKAPDVAKPISDPWPDWEAVQALGDPEPPHPFAGLSAELARIANSSNDRR